MASEKKPATGTAEATPDFHHHFERARERVALAGPDTLQDYELLELILHLLLPRGDTKPLAKALIERFGSFAGVLGADPALLAGVKAVGRDGKSKGLGPISITNLKLIQAASQRYAKGQVKLDQPILSSWSALIEYCRAQMAYEEIEQFRILYLDKKNRLITDEVQQTGTVDHAPVYPREVVRRSLELSATALILVHNHPSGDPAPSSADVQMTRQIADVARPLGITVHDHIIIGKLGHASMKALKLI